MSPEPIQITVNGLERRVEQGLSVAALLAAEREPAAHVLVEINAVYVPPGSYHARVLRPGDRVEIILPAFGG